MSEPGGFLSPHPPRDRRQFPTASGRAQVSAETRHVPYGGDGTLVLQSVRSHDQLNTTIYGLDDRYRGVSGGRRVLFVNPADLARLGFDDGQLVDVLAVGPNRFASPTGSGWCPIPRRSGAWPCTTPRRTCSSASTTSMPTQARRPTSRYRWSCVAPVSSGEAGRLLHRPAGVTGAWDRTEGSMFDPSDYVARRLGTDAAKAGRTRPATTDGVCPCTSEAASSSPYSSSLPSSTWPSGCSRGQAHHLDLMARVSFGVEHLLDECSCSEHGGVGATPSGRAFKDW